MRQIAREVGIDDKTVKRVLEKSGAEIPQKKQTPPPSQPEIVHQEPEIVHQRTSKAGKARMEEIKAGAPKQKPGPKPKPKPPESKPPESPPADISSPEINPIESQKPVEQPPVDVPPESKPEPPPDSEDTKIFRRVHKLLLELDSELNLLCHGGDKFNVDWRAAPKAHNINIFIQAIEKYNLIIPAAKAEIKRREVNQIA
jgi:hypothetical protein